MKNPLYRRLLAGLLPLLVGASACRSLSSIGQSSDEDSILQIWWSEGYYPEETETIRQAVADWSAEKDVEVDLVFYSEKDLIQQSESAIAAGHPPDILYGYSIEFSLIPRLAWSGELSDTSDIIEPIKTLYSPEALESVSYQNNKAGNRSYYAVPISQQTTHIHYWNDLLAKAELSPEQIPTEWNDFWRFWPQVQETLRSQGQKDTLYGMGIPMSTAATDTFYQFEQFLEAHNVSLIDSQGQLQLDDPQVKAGIVKSLEAFTHFYKQNYVPPNALDWGDPDNNVTFLSGLTVMTPNPTLSIPGSQRQDDITYRERMATVEWPDKPNGDPMRYIASTKQVAIFADSKQLNEAKELVAYLVKPDILADYVEGAQGRFFPVMPDLLQTSFWTDPTDPHISVAAQQFKSTRPLYTVLSPAYSQVQAENIWGQAIRSIAADNIAPEAAAESAISEIKRIFAEWK
ncbi:MAG: ABC transporter substrate-binding protein [Leptolyngbyaceae cyanobacterium MO_188.B28]|nr:ABC transporter substrate-binding protein [Leptolyngbyaceae cyanobacterium MO_188.B28]